MLMKTHSCGRLHTDTPHTDTQYGCRIPNTDTNDRWMTKWVSESSSTCDRYDLTLDQLALGLLNHPSSHPSSHPTIHPSIWASVWVWVWVWVRVPLVGTTSLSSWWSSTMPDHRHEHRQLAATFKFVHTINKMS